MRASVSSSAATRAASRSIVAGNASARRSSARRAFPAASIAAAYSAVRPRIGSSRSQIRTSLFAAAAPVMQRQALVAHQREQRPRGVAGLIGVQLRPRQRDDDAGHGARPRRVRASPPNQATRSGGGSVRAIAIAASVSAWVGPAFARRVRQLLARGGGIARADDRRPARRAAGRAPARRSRRRSIAEVFSSATCIQNQTRRCAVNPISPMPTPGSRPTAGRYSTVRSNGTLVKLNSRPAIARHRDARRAAAGRDADAAAQTEVPVEVEILRASRAPASRTGSRGSARCRRGAPYWPVPGPFESPWPQKPSTPWNAPGATINFAETPVAPVPEPMPMPNPSRGVLHACARDGASASADDAARAKINAYFHIRAHRTPTGPSGSACIVSRDGREQTGLHRHRLRRHDVEGRRRVGRRHDDLDEASAAADQRAAGARRGRRGLDRSDRRIPGAERPRRGSR